jgi:hypothetical protein
MERRANEFGGARLSCPQNRDGLIQRWRGGRDKHVPPKSGPDKQRPSEQARETCHFACRFIYESGAYSGHHGLQQICICGMHNVPGVEQKSGREEISRPPMPTSDRAA